MPAIREADIRAVLGDVEALVLGELVRTQATTEEFTRAAEFVRSRVGGDLKFYRALPRQTQRLVDLLSVTSIGETDARSHAA